jgi:hypothetical protein
MDRIRAFENIRGTEALVRKRVKSASSWALM